jgi:hypothetical protein
MGQGMNKQIREPWPTAGLSNVFYYPHIIINTFSSFVMSEEST